MELATDEEKMYMEEALKEAALAALEGEIPVGAILVQDGRVIARNHNRRERAHDATAHAEILVIREACEKLRRWRLADSTLYVTMEPCPMCAGAILNARIRRVWYGARDEAFGACGGVTNLFMEQFPHRPALVGGILAEDCQAVLAEFFGKLRQGKPSTQSF